ncbi:hypothetical protein [Salinicoccus halodurans]|uniref:YokE-like PH domain-containing protein n=1 Tax=Salinicoccus halodurans TaxID=407035 RepID=A0A0F7HLU0_9STAP|nr:hypothetical protein [Salinicoccus halodurans]AKG74343.1 hypothetical protein AAT16_08915 [Salinicoccus halodurans]SFK94772.1 hypothetical protein SAMN05216235_2680 [Salinicoccus halodurans]
MFSYHEINLHLDEIALPKPLSEITGKLDDFKGYELNFLIKAEKYLFDHLEYESYKSKVIHCIGTCRFNLTQVGLYLLMEDEIIFVHTSALKLDEDNQQWSLNVYPFKEIVSFEFNDGCYSSDDYNSGVLFIRLKNKTGTVRSKTIRNINPNHFGCMRDFHEKMQENRYI